MIEPEYIYATSYNAERNRTEWVYDMLAGWERTGKSRLCFSWVRSHPRKLPSPGEPFWLYIYYRKRQTNLPKLKGKVKIRVHVVNWGEEEFMGDSIHLHRHPEEGRVWFLCDRFEEVNNRAGGLLSFEDFAHAEGKDLGSAMRSSIPRVICRIPVIVKRRYP